MPRRHQPQAPKLLIEFLADRFGGEWRRGTLAEGRMHGR
jgi:hypothetical protein